MDNLKDLISCKSTDNDQLEHTKFLIRLRSSKLEPIHPFRRQEFKNYVAAALDSLAVNNSRL